MQGWKITFVHRGGGTKTVRSSSVDGARLRAAKVSERFPGAYLAAVGPRWDDGFTMSFDDMRWLPRELRLLAQSHG